MQNDLGELKSLLSFLLPDVFGPDSQQMDNLEEVRTPLSSAEVHTRTVTFCGNQGMQESVVNP